MKIFVHIFLTLSILISSCDKNNINPIPSEENSNPQIYPTTFFEISADKLGKMRYEYAIKNPYLRASLNNFGFADFLNVPIEVEFPPFLGVISKSEAIDIAMSFILNNRSETGVKNLSQLQLIPHYSHSTILGNGAIEWDFDFANQKVDTIEVLNSEIVIHILNSSVIGCSGNWYQGIEIPKVFEFSVEEAKAELLDTVVTHSTHTGLQKTTVRNTDLDNSVTSLKILPVETDEKIELRVCWQIAIPLPVSHKFWVDVITGEVVGGLQTIWF